MENKIAGCPVDAEIFKFIQSAAAGMCMDVDTFTAWAMTKWAQSAMRNSSEPKVSNV